MRPKIRRIVDFLPSDLIIRTHFFPRDHVIKFLSGKVLRVKIRFDGWVFESSNAIRLLARVIGELIDLANDPPLFAFRQNYKDKDGGKIVLYTTSMGIVRSTYAKCQTVKKILNTLMVKYEERDVFMSTVSDDSIAQRA